ncbi:WxcM-like, C-terminal [Hydrobacter penzbergensis]|uniref:WxcM-like, C-terminal n=1 Tax=Hydrobacter penzbergensis TaxID=1235997 RepID=A0A8X8IFC4_9BACT|nr:FdtA/QdtA family cupin domain-containing protein [Hydrobacter penzbergensis]SDW85775.1 WxcM-like, C-terminal [Hydrobacter penzbergensis]
MTISNIRFQELPKIIDERGNLSFVESPRFIPFDIKRVYWIYDVPGGEKRGGHAYRTLNEMIIALSGSFDVEFDDGENKAKYTLNRSYTGIFVPQLIWRSLTNFSTNALCLIIASEDYDENNYIRNYSEFVSLKKIASANE